jgi:hypothetical protein
VERRRDSGDRARQATSSAKKPTKMPEEPATWEVGRQKWWG